MSSVYKPIKFGKHSFKKSEFTDTKQKLVATNICEICKKIKSVRSKISKQSEYSHFLTAINAFSKSMDESDIGWVVLDLAISLEALCKFQNLRTRSKGNCDSSDGIHKSLGILSQLFMG